MIILLGNDTTFGASDTSHLFFARFQAVASGVLDTIKLVCSGSGNAKVAIYSDDPNYSDADVRPLSRLAYTGSTAVVSGTNEISISNVSIVSGTYYWLAGITDSTIVKYKSGSDFVLADATRTYSTFSYGSSFTYYSNCSSQTYVHGIAGWGTVPTSGSLVGPGLAGPNNLLKGVLL